jgi:hypothetical protein
MYGFSSTETAFLAAEICKDMAKKSKTARIGQSENELKAVKLLKGRDHLRCGRILKKA